MTVKQLIAQLQKHPPNSQVVIDKGYSGEGSPLAGVESGHYVAETTWHGSLLHPDDVTEHDGAKSVVVLCPVN